MMGLGDPKFAAGAGRAVRERPRRVDAQGHRGHNSTSWRSASRSRVEMDTVEQPPPLRRPPRTVPSTPSYAASPSATSTATTAVFTTPRQRRASSRIRRVRRRVGRRVVRAARQRDHRVRRPRSPPSSDRRATPHSTPRSTTDVIRNLDSSNGRIRRRVELPSRLRPRGQPDRPGTRPSTPSTAASSRWSAPRIRSRTVSTFAAGNRGRRQCPADRSGGRRAR